MTSSTLSRDATHNVVVMLTNKTIIIQRENNGDNFGWTIWIIFGLSLWQLKPSIKITPTWNYIYDILPNSHTLKLEDISKNFPSLPGQRFMCTKNFSFLTWASILEELPTNLNRNQPETILPTNRQTFPPWLEHRFMHIIFCFLFAFLFICFLCVYYVRVYKP